MSADLNTIVEQIRTLLGLHGYTTPRGGIVLDGFCDEATGFLKMEELDAEAAAGIARTLADHLVVLAGDGPFAGTMAENRAIVVRHQAERRRVAGMRDLATMNVVAWLEERFRERREWPYDDLRDASRDEGVDHQLFFSPEVKALPIRRKRMPDDGTGTKWLWVAAARWPAGNTRPRTRRRRQEGAAG